MDFSWLADPVTWLGFATLIILEVVLGIDNLVFVAILAGKVRPAQRDRARITGLTLAVLIRLLMLAFMSRIMQLTTPLFALGRLEVAGKDIIMFVGGLFLLYRPPPSCTNGWKAPTTMPFPTPTTANSMRRFGAWCCRLSCSMPCFPSMLW